MRERVYVQLGEGAEGEGESQAEAPLSTEPDVELVLTTLKS